MFPSGQVGPVNASLCTGYTDPQHQTDENSCRTFLSTIESAITDYCSDNFSATECADADGNPALLTNLVPYDQLPDGVRRLLARQDYLGRFGFETIGAAANVYGAITKGKAPLMWEAGKVWAGIIEDRLENGGSLSELEQEVNTGYILDPLFGNVYRNDIFRIETREVLEHAYRHPVFYQLLHDNGFPVPFAMDDFNPATTEDDNARNELNGVVDRIKRELSREWRNVSEDSDQYKEELAKRIYDWLVQWKLSNNFAPDPLNERTDYDAYSLHKGDCTELSAILHYLYNYAGLDPVFLMNQDFEPRLGMLFLIYQKENDHVMVGIPRTWGRTLGVDPAGEMYDVRFMDSIAVSPMNFALGTVSNNIIMAQNEQDAAAITRESKLYLQMSPDSLQPYMLSLTTFLESSENFAELRTNIEQASPDHPMADFLLSSGAWLRSILGGDQSTIDTASTALGATLREMEASDSHVAAMGYSDLYSRVIRLVQGARSNGLQLGNDAEMERKLYEQAIWSLGKLITLNPNDIFAIFKAYRSVFDTGRYQNTAQFFAERAAQHPSNSIFRYLAARLYSLSAEYGEDSQFSAGVEKAIDEAQRLIPLEPQSPIPYFLLADLYALNGKEDDTLYHWNRGRSLMAKPYERAAVIEFMRSGLRLGHGEDILSFFRDEGPDAAVMLLLTEHVFEATFSANESSIRANRNILATIKLLLERALTLPGADADLIKAVALKYTALVAVMNGLEESQSWLQLAGDISDPDMQIIVAGAVSGFNAILHSGSSFATPYLKNLYDWLSSLDTQSLGDQDTLLVSIFMSLASRLIRAGEQDKARASFDKARSIDDEAASRALASDQRLSDFINGVPECRTFFGIPCDFLERLNRLSERRTL